MEPSLTSQELLLLLLGRLQQRSRGNRSETHGREVGQVVEGVGAAADAVVPTRVVAGHPSRGHIRRWSASTGRVRTVVVFMVILLVLLLVRWTGLDVDARRHVVLVGLLLQTIIIIIVVVHVVLVLRGESHAGHAVHEMR